MCMAETKLESLCFTEKCYVYANVYCNHIIINDGPGRIASERPILRR